MAKKDFTPGLPDKPVGIKERIKLFFTPHTILALIIAGGGSAFLVYNADEMTEAGFWFWFILISVVTTLLIGNWVRDWIKKTY